MFLRKMAVAFFPLILCAITCFVLRITDELFANNAFWAYGIKGFLIGVVLALLLPVAGIKTFTNGLTDWLFLGSGLLFAVLLYQMLENEHVLHSVLLNATLPYNGQILLTESAFMGCMLMTAILCHVKKNK